MKLTVRGEELTLELKEEGALPLRSSWRGDDITQTLLNLDVPAERLSALEVDFQDEGAREWVPTLIFTLLPIVLIGVFLWYLTSRAQQGAMQAFSFGRNRAKLFSPAENRDRVTFNDVAGADEAKEELKEVVEFLKHPKKFLDIGARIPRGVILVGQPGTGKTLLARAVAGEANVPFFHISGSEFVEMFVGVGASRVRDLFAEAKRHSPAIIFIDEIDAVGRMRGAGLGGGHDEREQTLNQILTEMDGFDRDTNVIVIAATNRPDVLDPALLRPGRFDRRVVLDPPDIKAREEILKIHAKTKKLSNDVNLRAIAERTPGFSGADLANVTNEAAILAARRNKKTLGQQELSEAIDKVSLGPERKSRRISPKEKEITAYHEAGHALVAAFSDGADPVHKVSIVSRGMAGGYTQQLPIEDRSLYTKTQFLSRIAVMLGGYAAEELVFKELTTGASNDLQNATGLARRIVTEYGMSKKIGPVTYPEREEQIFLGRDIATQPHYSEATAQLIDKEVNEIIFAAHKRATQALQTKRAVLKKVAEKLMEVETLEETEFYKLIGRKGPKRQEYDVATKPVPSAAHEPTS
jgi:cell division protease FtsH